MQVAIKNYKFTPLAKDDLHQIWSYSCHKWGEAQAEKYTHSLFAKIHDLIDFPYIGRDRNELLRGCRSFTAGQHIIFYRLKGDVIEILRLLHTQCELPELFQ